ncbi:MAG: cation diffusion facilitator family transporter [Actinomycetota bacterium]
MGAGHAHPSALTGAEGTKTGLRAIRLASVALGASAALRLTIAIISGSVALLASGLDDLGDVLTTIALSLAFVASRRAADERYTFGYQRAEDLGGVLVVIVIWVSAGIATFEGIDKLIHHRGVGHIPLALAAASIGLLGNGFAAFYKIRVGRKIGSEPLVADGKHAMTDGLAAIAAIIGLIGARSGASWADPVAGLAVAVAIGWVAFQATRQVLTRLLDAVDPSIVNRISEVALHTDGVMGLGRVQARWAGRSLYITMTVAVDGHLPVDDAHEIAEHLHHEVLHRIPEVAQVDIHVDPWSAHGSRAHDHTTKHDPRAMQDHHEETLHPHEH